MKRLVNNIKNIFLHLLCSVTIFVVGAQPVDSSSEQVAGNLLYLDVSDKQLTNKQKIAASKNFNISGLRFGNFYLRGAVHQSVSEKLGF